MKRILISDNGSTNNYVEAVKFVGAKAIVCDTIDSADLYDGLLLTGGCDINPQLYGEKIDGSVKINCTRDKNEIKMIQLFLEANKPIMGICRGSQLLNVYFGGSLYQDIACTEIHTRENNKDKTHKVTALKNSVVYSLFGAEFVVNSAHHQAINKLGKNLIATHFCDDIIEGFEHKYLKIFGFQWHPERTCLAHKNSLIVDGIDIFKNFVDLYYNNMVAL